MNVNGLMLYLLTYKVEEIKPIKKSIKGQGCTTN